MGLVVGITGKSGSGKSFISTELSKKDERYLYVNLDDYLLGFFKKFRSKIIKQNKNHASFFKDLVTFPVEYVGFLLIKYNLIDEYCKIVFRDVNKLIEKNQNKIILLDNWVLPLVKLNCICDVKILVNADLQTRISRVVSRGYYSEKVYKLREKSISNVEEFYSPKKYDFYLNTTNLTPAETEHYICLLNDNFTKLLEKKHYGTLEIKENRF